MWREDELYDLTFVLDQNFTRRCKGRGSAVFFHIARPGLTPTAGCVAIAAADMRKLAPRLARGRDDADRLALARFPIRRRVDFGRLAARQRQRRGAFEMGAHGGGGGGAVLPEDRRGDGAISPTEVRNTSPVSASPTWAMMSGSCRRIDTSRS